MVKRVSEMTEQQRLKHRQRENELRRLRRKEKRLMSPDRSTKLIAERLENDLSRSLITTEVAAIEMDERQKAFMHFFYKYNSNIAAACTAAGITRATYDSWLKRCPQMQEQMTEVNEAILDLAEQQLLKNISAGKENSLFFLLCNKGKHRGWQDIRKLAAPKMKAININVGYFGESDNHKNSGIRIVESEEVVKVSNDDEEYVDA